MHAGLGRLLLRWVTGFVLLGGLTVAEAQAHPSFVSSQPGAGARVEQTPGRVVLRFTEPLNRRLSRAELRAPGGEIVPLAAMAAQQRQLLLRPRKGLRTGSYRVTWHTVSTDDGHALEGSFAFGIRAAAAGGTQSIVVSPLARSGWVRVLLRGGLYVSLILLAGALLVPLLIRDGRTSWLAPRDGPVADVERRARSVRDATAWSAVLLAVGVTLAETHDAAGGVGPAALTDYLTTSSAGVARIGLLAALGFCALAGARHVRLAASALVLAFGAIALSGHAAGIDPRGPAVLNDWVHLIAGGVWVGGTAVLAVAWGPELRRRSSAQRRSVAKDVLPPFGRIALPAFALVASTGAVNLVIQLGHLDALWNTAYGRVLSVKVILVGIVATLSAVHAFRLRPPLLSRTASPRRERRHWRLLRNEPIVGLAVIALAALLVAFPLPPRQLDDADEAVAAQPVCDPCPLPAPTPDELAVAEQAGPYVVAGWIRRSARGVSGTVRVYDRAARPARVDFEVDAPGGGPCGTGCRRFDGPARDRIAVTLATPRGAIRSSLPVRWVAGEERAGRRLLEASQATMRRLRSVRQVEEVTSGPGTGARTTYRLQAPDRFAFRTDGGVETVVIGSTQWLRTRATPWQRTSYGSGIPFALRQWFRWTVFATHLRVLRRQRVGGRPRVQLALMDPATPAWIRLTIDVRTKRVLREEMVSQKHRTTSDYSEFDRATEIEAPRVP